MNCGRVQQLLSNSLDGVMPGREAGAVAAHLRDCDACRRLRAEFMALEEEARQIEKLQPAPCSDVRYQAIELWIAERSAPPSRGWRGFLALSLPQFVPQAWRAPAAAAVLVVLLALAWWTHGRISAPPGIRIAQRPSSERIAPATPSGPHSRPSQAARRAGLGRLALLAGPSSALASPGPPHAGGIAAGRESHPSPHSRLQTPMRAGGDVMRVNEDPLDGARQGVSMPAETWDAVERRVRHTVPVRDDFVLVPFPRLASTADRSIAEAVESYKHEAAIVDSRLSREVTVQQKATALSDLCDRLRADTGIPLTAGSSVADEKVTVFCEKQPLRDVMRQLSRPFGYTWLRSGKMGEYRYELVQDLRSQLLEEELRNREQNAALLALDREIQRYRKYLDLSPDEALARAQTAAPEEKKLLERLAKDGWGPIHMYFRLSPSDFAALKSGQELKFSAEPDQDERPLSAEVARGVLQSDRNTRLVRRDDDRFRRVDKSDPNGVPLTALPEARALVSLRLSQSELGQFTLGGGSGYRALRVSALGGDGPYAVGQSPTSIHPDNRQANASLAGDPALRVRVSVRPQPSCEGARGPMADARPAPNAGQPIPGEPSAGKPQIVGITAASQRPDSRSQPGGLIRGGNVVEGPGAQGPGGRSIPGEPSTRTPRATYADLLEALHRATGLPVVADAYTRLYEPEAVSIRDQPLFDALNRLADTVRLRWSFADGKWLQFRSASYFNDRLKEVPNRLLARWSASRRQHGALTLADLAEIAQLSDAQLDAAEAAEGAQECFDLQEWPLAQDTARPHLRYLASFTQAQQQAATSSAGLAFRQMSLAQQQQFIQLAFYQYAKRPPTAGISLGELEGASLRVGYRQPGEFQWWPAGDLPQNAAELSLVSGPTREEALQRARRIDPQVDPDGIVPAEPGVIFQYLHRRPLTIRATLRNGTTIF